MRKITVKDILKLDIMKGSRIVAGENGLDNEVRYISIYDNPISDSDFDIPLFAGDIYLTFFYYGIKDEHYIRHSLKMMIDHKASALIIFDEYFKELPDYAAEICNNAGLPVIFIDCNTPYSLLISSIMEYRILAEQRRNTEEKLALIAGSKISPTEKLDLIYDLNSSLQNNVVVFFVIEKDRLTNMYADDTSDINLLNYINRNTVDFASSYRNGILIIRSFRDAQLSNIDDSISETVDQIHKHLPMAFIGISNVCTLPDLGRAISQSSMAVSSGAADYNGIARYDQLGIGRILLELQGSTTIDEFYNDITSPIEDADSETGSALFDTMLAFAANDMDYKKTSQAMFVHENTIRYRISKIKDLIPYGRSEIDFYETISVVSKIYNMKHF